MITQPTAVGDTCDQKVAEFFLAVPIVKYLDVLSDLPHCLIPCRIIPVVDNRIIIFAHQKVADCSNFPRVIFSGEFKLSVVF